MSRNRLAEETSPYLLQHQDNPVHWQPWGDDAFAAAMRARDAASFLDPTCSPQALRRALGKNVKYPGEAPSAPATSTRSAGRARRGGATTP